MASISDYLNKLINQKNALADNISAKGIEASHDETLETLIPKMLDVPQGIYPIGTDSRPTGDVIVPEGVTSLYRYIFDQNSSVTSVKLPSTVTMLDSYCFQGCNNLKSVTAPAVIEIPGYCFSRCTALEKAVLGSNLTIIDKYAFEYCSNLIDIDISQDASFDIEMQSFQYSGITNEGVNNLITHASSLGTRVFWGCESITEVDVNKTAVELFRDCTNLTKAVLRDITSIDKCVFDNCTSLKTVCLPSTITSAVNNSLTSTGIAYYVFNGCTALEDVQLGQDWNMSIRLNVSNNITVESMVAMFNSLKDLTGDTAKTLTLGSTNLAKLTDEQRAIATNKNWNLA